MICIVLLAATGLDDALAWVLLCAGAWLCLGEQSWCDSHSACRARSQIGILYSSELVFLALAPFGAILGTCGCRMF